MTSDNDDSLTTASDRLRAMISTCSLSVQEQERRTRARQRLRERCLSIPWGQEQDEKEGEAYWRSLHDSAVLSD